MRFGSTSCLKWEKDGQFYLLPEVEQWESASTVCCCCCTCSYLLLGADGQSDTFGRAVPDDVKAQLL